MTKVYIGGIYRSGTTFVQKFLDAQPTAHVFYQSLGPLLQLVDRQFQARRTAGKPTAPMTFEDMSADPDLSRALDLVHVTADDARRLVETARHAPAIADDYPARRFADILAASLQSGTARAAVASYFSTGRLFHDAVESAVIGFKEIFADPYLIALLDAFTDLKVIHLLRDPRAVLASRNHRDIQRAASPLCHPLAMVASTWTNSASYAEEAARRYPDRVLRLRFEDLMADKVVTMERILRLLDLPLADGVFDEGKFTTARGAAWRANSSFADGPGQSSQRWTTLLPPEAVGAMEHLCRSRMVAEGYAPRYSVEDAARLFAAYGDPIETLKPWTKPYALAPDRGVGACLRGQDVKSE
ncbi:MAG: sulfotransferase [Rhodospirillum sp.]|nr:sulfotransferase [Rhodospirillum sp.]MCF8490776.1 sulfotransferase [Rhodospirillum sp.]